MPDPGYASSYNDYYKAGKAKGKKMPLTKKGKKIMKAMKKSYGGKKKAEEVFYASKNKGTIKGVDMKKMHKANSNIIQKGSY